MVVKYRQHNSERHIMFLSCEIQKAEHGEECHVIVKYSSTWGDMSCSCEIQQNMKRYDNFVMFLLIPNTWQNRMQNCRLVYILQNFWVAQRLSCCTSNYNVCLYFTARQEGTLWVQLNILVLSFVLCQGKSHIWARILYRGI